MDSQSIAVNREWLDKLQADKATLERANELLVAELGRLKANVSEIDYDSITAVLAAAKELTN